MERITSAKNPRVAMWRSLKDKKGRQEHGLFLAEGRKMTWEALASSFRVEAVLAEEEKLAELTLPEGIPCFALPGELFRSVCDTRTPQGIAALVRLPEEMPLPRGRRLVALDGVQDPGNVGTILRTADAAGFDGALLSRACADVFSPKVLRATMGSIFRLKLQVTDALPDRLRELRESGCAVLASQLDGEPFYQRSVIEPPLCLIIGSEGNGISPEAAAQATHHLRLPMRGGAESLNAAVAAGIMMYDLMREVPE